MKKGRNEVVVKISLLSFDERECEWKGKFSGINLAS